MPYYFKNRDREFGPYEDRVIISFLIDGEINSRSLIKYNIDGEYKKIEDTQFDAVLPNLTKRWRYNIGALKREFFFLVLSLILTLIPMLSFLGCLYHDVFREYLLKNGFLGYTFGFTVLGLIATSYFTWMFAYRCYRVVPKSQYNIKPGWRIMLTYIPFVRLGWNFYMWGSLCDKLRRLTNYTMYAGKVAAIFYSISMIVMTVFAYLVVFFRWPHKVLDFSFEQSLWENVVGCTFVGILLISFVTTVVTFIIMTNRLRRVALAILNRRYAYNITNNVVKSPFMLSVLKHQREQDKKRRWGHGLGIAGVLVGWPLLLIGVPYLVLAIVGSVKLNYAELKYGDELLGLYDKREHIEAKIDSNSVTKKPHLDSMNVKELTAMYDSINNEMLNDNVILQIELLKNVDLIDEVLEDCKVYLIQKQFGLYLYQFTPFIYFSKEKMTREYMKFSELATLDYYQITDDNINNLFEQSLLCRLLIEKSTIKNMMYKKSLNMTQYRKNALQIAEFLNKKSNGTFEIPQFKNAITGEILK